MPFLTLSHVTTYTYRHPVAFGEHRIMVRPRESHDQNVLDETLTISPEPSDVRWLQDVFGNSVAIATFDKRAKELVFDSRIRLERRGCRLLTWSPGPAFRRAARPVCHRDRDLRHFSISPLRGGQRSDDDARIAAARQPGAVLRMRA